MKKILLIIFPVLILWACNKEKDPAELDADITSLSFEQAMDIKQISISSNTSWTAVVDDPSWCSVSPTSGEGNCALLVQALANDGESARATTLTIIDKSGATASITITITQESIKPSITVTPKTRLISADSKSFTVAVVANVTFEIRENAAWITATTQSVSNDTSTILITVPANSGAERSGHVFFMSEAIAYDSLHITQLNENPTYTRRTDSLALVDLYYSTRGLTWDLDQPIDTWPEIFMYQDRVDAIAIEEINLTGTLPESLGFLTELTMLSAGGNRLSGPIPSELGDLPNLAMVYLYNNRLTGGIPDSFNNLLGITEIIIEENCLSGVVPDRLLEDDIYLLIICPQYYEGTTTINPNPWSNYDCP